MSRLSASSLCSLGLLVLALVALAPLATPRGHVDAIPTPYDNTTQYNGTFPSPAFPVLYTTRNFAVLSGAGVTRTAGVRVYGDVGSFPTPVDAVTFTHDGGITHPAADATCGTGQYDVTVLYNSLKALACDVTMDNIDLGGLTLYPAVYCFGAAASLAAGVLTLDGAGDTAAVWIFQVTSSLDLAENTVVRVQNGGSNCAVFFAVGSTAVVGDNVNMAGSIVVYQSINVNTGVQVSGSLLARIGSITFTGPATIGSQPCCTDTQAISSSATEYYSSSSSAASELSSSASELSSSGDTQASSSAESALSSSAITIPSSSADQVLSSSALSSSGEGRASSSGAASSSASVPTSSSADSLSSSAAASSSSASPALSSSTTPLSSSASPVSSSSSPLSSSAQLASSGSAASNSSSGVGSSSGISRSSSSSAGSVSTSAAPSTYSSYCGTHAALAAMIPTLIMLVAIV